MRRALILAVILLAVLAWLNPEMDDFQAFAQTQSERLILRETGEGRLGEAVAGVGGALAGSLIDRVTERRTYLFFSTYTVDLDGADEEGDEWRFLGLGGRFFELEKPASLREQDSVE